MIIVAAAIHEISSASAARSGAKSITSVRSNA